MATTLTIAGTDRSNQIDWRGLRVSQVLTKRIDTMGFMMTVTATKTTKPVVGQEVILTVDGTKQFGGVITQIDEELTSPDTLEYKVKAQDYAKIMDSKLVAETYENTTVNAIIADLIANKFDTGVFTDNNVNAAVTIDYAQFNYLPGTEVLNQLAEMTGYDWYVDYDKDIHFFLPSAGTAPFELDDTSGNYDFYSLKLHEDNTQLRNSIILRGGTFLGTSYTEPIEANGTDLVYKLAYGYNSLTVEVASVSKTVGIDNIDDFTTHDVLYNFQEKIIRFNDAGKPTNGQLIEVTGLPHLPVIVQSKEQASIDAQAALEGIGDGEYQYLILDQSINSKDGARQRATAEIETYGEKIIAGSFTTETAGLEVGQKIRLNSPLRARDEQYIISQIQLRYEGGTRLKFDVKLITTKQFGFIELLRRLILEDTNKIKINPNELIHLIAAANEPVEVSDAYTLDERNPQVAENANIVDSSVEGIDTALEFVLGEFGVPVGDKREFYLNQSLLGQL